MFDSIVPKTLTELNQEPTSEEWKPTRVEEEKRNNNTNGS